MAGRVNAHICLVNAIYLVLANIASVIFKLAKEQFAIHVVKKDLYFIGSLPELVKSGQ